MSVDAWVVRCIAGSAALAAAGALAGPAGLDGFAESEDFAELEDFVYAPEAGTELERHWAETLALEADALDQTIGGTPVDMPFDAIEFTAKRSFELADALEEVAGGRVTRLVRGFTSSELGFELVLDGNVTGLAEGRHACDGSKVRFAWEDEEQRYARERLEGELDDERLETLEPDLDLLGLLPAGALEPGEAFEPPAEALRTFFHAGGDLDYRLKRIELRHADVPAELVVAGALGSLHELFAPGSELAGELEGRYVGREEEDAELARFEYELELEVGADLGQRFRSFMKESTPDSHDLQLTLELEGELVLLWDVSAKRPRSARFAGEVVLKGHVVFPVQAAAGAEPREFVGDYELSGEAEVELESE